MKAAVIYYSKSGVTEGIAQKIQTKYGADLYPVQPDKSYGGYLSSVASVAGEKLSRNMAKPQTEIVDLTDYDVVFIGFPVWYTTMPQFLQTYIAGCDLKGKRVIPFATATANGRESSYKTVQALCPNSQITDYFYTSSLKKADADAWLEGIKF